MPTKPLLYRWNIYLYSFTYSDGWGSSYAGNTYYVRAYATNSNGTVYGSALSFTIPSVPTIGFSNTYEAPYYYSSNITNSSIKLMTNISNYGASYLGYSNVNERGLLYTTSSSVSSTSPTSSNISTNASDASTKWVKVSNGSPASSVATISSLSSNTVYYIKSYATTNWGTGYSSTTKTVKTALTCGQTLTDQDGNTYATVTIGSQCWMKTNLKASHYDNMTNYGSTGTAITHKDAGSSNLSTTVPYRYTPYSGTNYGFLYNWPGATGYSVNNSPATTGAANMGTSSGKNQGACPRGWHIPTYSEMSTLNGLLDNVTNKNNFIGNDAYAYKYPGYIAASTGSYTAS